jgi:heptaprenylglyceryl phosphate synthase
VPLFVGGGIRSPEQARAARAAGADFVVIGSVVEGASGEALEGFVQAVRA